MGVSEIYQTLVDRTSGPKLLQPGKTSASKEFAIIGNLLNFAGWGGTGGLLPNSGLVENRSGYEWEMGCISWLRDGVNNTTVPDPALAGPTLPTTEGFGSNSESKVIKFRCNPAEVQWTMRQRSEEQKTKAGTVLHVWNDRDRNTYFDEPVITLNLQAGNILPVRNIDAATTPEIPAGLNNFYEFLSLVDEVKVLNDGRANLCYIKYNSLIFPSLTLWGFFTPDGISFRDTASNHATVNDWTASFTVYKTDIGQLGRNTNFAGPLADGRMAGEALKQRFRDAGYPFRNKRSENFSLFQDFDTTLTAVLSGQIPIADAAKAGKALVNASSQRVVNRTAVAAVAGAALVLPNRPRFGSLF